MSTLQITTPQRNQSFLLSSSTRIGRHWSCDLVLTEEAVPLLWLELRYRDNTWWWSPLSAAERIRTRSGRGDGRWFAWSKNLGPIKLSLPVGEVSLNLLDEGPPQLLVEDQLSRHRYTGVALSQFLEQWSDGRVWPLGTDPNQLPSLRDGEPFVVDGRPYRVHLPIQPIETQKTTILDLTNPEIHIDLFVETLTLVMSLGEAECRFSGEAVRVLLSYAKARLADPSNGWLSTQAAYDAWVACGGRAESEVERVNWERGRLRTALSNLGVIGLGSLFETRKRGKTWEARLALRADQVTLL